VVAIGIAGLFAGIVLALLQALPKPRTQFDYLIAGGVATMVSILALFAVLLSTHFKVDDPFFKKRPK
jgi:uncharacterized membrane protein YjfL (UPF0719 family)